jgi:hypothetical protein
VYWGLDSDMYVVLRAMSLIYIGSQESDMYSILGADSDM